MTEHEQVRGRTDEPTAPDRGDREAEVAHEIAESVLTASSPLEVYRVALARVTPMVDAGFASVFLRDAGDPTLLRLVCAHNWPQSSARHLAAMRIREGRGPTGQAVSTRRPVEVVDVFADPALKEWWEPARELSFVSMIALPLIADADALGAVSFYFAEEREFSDADRALLRLVAHQLTAMASRAEGGPGAVSG